MNQISEIPFLRIIIPFVLGIILYFTFGIDLSLQILLFGLLIFTFLIFILIIKFKNAGLKIYFGILSQIFLVVLGYHLSVENNIKRSVFHYSNINQSADYFIGRVKSIPVIKSNKTKVELEIKYTNSGKKFICSVGNILVYFPKEEINNLSYGNHLLISSSLRQIEGPKNPGDFDYRDYLKSKNIFHSIYAKPGSYGKIFIPENSILYDLAFRLKIKLLQILRAQFKDPQEFSIIASLLFGYDDEISSDLSKAYAVTGTIHVLSVSGLHIGIIYLMLNYFFGFLDYFRIGKLLKFFFVAVGVWLFAMISGLSPSVVRASSMCTIFLFAKVINRQSNSINTLLASAFFILYANPYLLKDIGFQLSYLALGGIIIFQPTIKKWFCLENKILNKTWGLIAVSISAQIATFPLTIYYFNNFSLLFIISNLVIIPISTLVMYGGILILIFSPIQFVIQYLEVVIVFFVKSMNFFALKLSSLPGAQISEIFIDKVELFLIFSVIIILTIFLYEKSKIHFFGGLIFFILLLLHLNIKYFSESKQEGFIVYHDNKNTSVDFIKGYKALTFGNQTSSSVFYKSSEHINDVDKIRIKSNVVYNVNGTRICFPETKKIRHNKKIDLFILRGDSKLSINELFNCFPDAKIISDGTVQFSKNLRWSLIADSLNLDYWSTDKNGAYLSLK